MPKYNNYDNNPNRIRELEQKTNLSAHPNDLKRIIDEASFGLGDTSLLKVSNYLLGSERMYEYDDPVYEFLSILRDPHFFYFTCKWLFNIDLLPFQCVILEELWNRKFPMLIMNRGGSKSFLLGLYSLLRTLFIDNYKIIAVGAGMRQSKIIFDYMDQIWRGAPILRKMVGDSQKQGPKRSIDRCTFYIGNSETIASPIGDGCLSPYTIITYDNKFGYIQDKHRTVYGNGNFHFIDHYFDNGYKDTKIVTTKMGYSYEGTYNHRMKVLRDNIVDWVRTDEMKVGDSILIDRSYRWHCGNYSFTPEDAYNLGIWLGNDNNEFPSTILSASRKNMMCCLNGLFYTSGSIISDLSTNTILKITHKNRKLLKQLHYILLHYGVISRLDSRNKLYIDWDNICRYVQTIPLDDNVYYDQIISIENSQSETYDIHVPDGNEYCANGFFSHNSKIRGMRANSIIADEFSCLGAKTLVETNLGIFRIEDIINNQIDCQLYTGDSNNPLESPIKFIKTPLTDVYLVEMVGGYQFKCSSIHKVDTKKGFKLAKDLTTNDYLNFNNYYKFPFDEIRINGVVLDKDMAYLFGKLIAKNHCVTLHYEKLLGFFDSQSIPWSILKSSQSIVLSFLSGLFNTGGIFNSKDIVYYSNHEQLCREIQFLLLKLDIISEVILNNQQWQIKINCGNAYKLCQFLQLSEYNQYNTYFNSISSLSFLRVKKVTKLDKQEQLYDFYLPKSHSFTANGFRHHNSLSEEIFEVVIKGFAATSMKPIDRVKQFHAMEIYKQHGLLEQMEEEKKKLSFGNQVIISGTAYYAFNHFYSYWRKYKQIINSGGDYHRLMEVFQNDVPENFNYKDYSIIRIPYFILPKGFLDETQVAQSQALIHTSVFNMEYLACHSPTTDIVTKDGLKHIVDVRIGDEVLTHRGRFRKVTKLFNRLYCGSVRKIQLCGYNKPLICTPEHPFYDGQNWIRADEIDNYTTFPTSTGLFLYIKVQSNQSIDYNGLVYNLEVEEDNTYVLPGAIVHNCFAEDSDGFFKRSLVEKCVCKEPIRLPSGDVQFEASTKGSPNLKYVYGIDPASEHDNFAIIILEVHPDHRRIIYCWTITRDKLKDKLKKGAMNTSDQSFYSYCAKKIRELMRTFPTENIGMDTMGGGIAVMEALHDASNVGPGELPIWPYVKQGETDPLWWESDKKPTDDEHGLHILNMVQFSNAAFTMEANHGLRKDFETQSILFPRFNAATLSIALSEDKRVGREMDTLEDCVMEIEELKDELAIIAHDQTANGRDRWDTPEIKIPGMKKSRLRKDRYTALIIANQIARLLDKKVAIPAYSFSGGYVGQQRKKTSGKLYVGPERLVGNIKGTYGTGLKK
jgi:intein/homing endonuclease